MQTETLAVDFGTSNTAAAILTLQGVRRIPIEQAGDTLPTAVFFPADESRMQIGAAAREALISGDEGRYMQALKSVLGLPLVHEARLIGGKRRTIGEIITAFLTELRQRAEAQTGTRFRRVLSGRPVHFHTANVAADGRAEGDLRNCYLEAGFEEVAFLPEPEAAALSTQAEAGDSEIGLVVDIGGGTSDFTAFRRGSSSDGAGPQVLASHGIRLGGTDFDTAVSLRHVMPLLGLGGQLRRQMGPGLLPVPRAIYADLATWAKIPFLYNGETRRMVSEMERLAVEPAKMARLSTVLEMELGHELAFAVEHGKIAANRAGETAGIRLGFVEARLSAAVSPASLDAALADSRAGLREAAGETLRMAGVEPGAVGRIILVGGSSLMGIVPDEMRALCPNATTVAAGAFTAVIDGLALATRR